jgi:hypothetical protein
MRPLNFFTTPCAPVKRTWKWLAVHLWDFLTKRRQLHWTPANNFKVSFDGVSWYRKDLIVTSDEMNPTVF